jgi:HK97 family phage major capsid protein
MVTEVTTSELFSAEVVNELVVEPLFQASIALSTLRRITTQSTSYSLPKTNRGSAGFVPELTQLPDAELAPEMIQITPKKCATYQVASNESVNDAQAAVIIGTALVDALAMAVDDAFFNGALNGPDGLPGIIDVQQVVGGAVDDPDSYVDGVSLIESVGGRAGAIYMSPASWAALAVLKVTDGSRQPVLLAPGAVGNAAQRSLNGVPVFVSSKCPDDVAWIVDVTRTIAVVRMPFEVAASDSGVFNLDGTAIRAVGRVEFGSVYGETVAMIGGGS